MGLGLDFVGERGGKALVDVLVMDGWWQWEMSRRQQWCGVLRGLFGLWVYGILERTDVKWRWVDDFGV